MDRYARQRRLAAVGDAGQARIAATTFEVAGESLASLSPAALIESEYLNRAGARCLQARAGEQCAFVHASSFQHAASREYAAGAWRALLQLRRVLEETPP